MQLLTSPTSPYCRKVEVLLRESGLDSHVTETNASGTPLEPNATTTAANPIGKIPVLIRDDGPALYDSRVICRYLDSLAGGVYYPEKRLWEVLTLEATADGILDAALLMAYEWRLRPEEIRFEPWVDGQWDKIARALDVIEARWISHLEGRLGMGHIAVGAALGYLDFRHDARGWRTGRPLLTDWFTRFSERPSMQDTVPAL
ncbi:glutathione S-transferase [Alphaproteobacteria bacterium GH1-50]|uniref:Glutathione S-transferase n=1 Tax=Kangsaoukella pontilimi TaxID=2691042 RepID=A0A7C9IGM0_9RHOB|nr:glutathione S-transferase [Kangsaoukella pontilimi]MXQ08129.1 glutathione S-transferase [Kangsaoukella pontilimi]